MKLTTSSPYNLDEVVFENRNKLYGAYALRKSYDSHLAKAMLGSLAFFLLLYSGLYLKSAIVPVPHYDKMDEPVVIDTRPIELIVELPPAPQPPVARIQPRTNNGEMQIVAQPPQTTVTPPAPPTPVTPTAPTIPGTGDATATTPPGTITGITPVSPSIDDLPSGPVGTKDLDFLPEFPGGAEEMEQYLQNNLQYPDLAYTTGREGKVLVSFIIEKDGTIKDVKVVQSVGFGCDEEAMRVVAKMPKWKPGKQKGRDVAVRFTLPIRFVLD